MELIEQFSIPTPYPKGTHHELLIRRLPRQAHFDSQRDRRSHAYEIINDRPEGIIPTASGRFTIVRHDYTVGDERSVVPSVLMPHPRHRDVHLLGAYPHDPSVQRTFDSAHEHLHRFITALLAPSTCDGWDDARKWYSRLSCGGHEALHPSETQGLLPCSKYMEHGPSLMLVRTRRANKAWIPTAQTPH